MKNTSKSLALALVFCIVVCLFADLIPDKLITNVEAVRDEFFDCPDIVNTEEANNYVGRVKTEEKDLYTFVFANSDGTNTMRVYSHPVKYVTDDGSVRDIALDIKAKNDGGFVTADHEIITTFEKNLTEGISLEYDDTEIILVPELGLGTEPTATLSADGKIVTYEMNDITSFVYELTYAGFKEDIVVEEYTGQTEYNFTLFTNGLALCEQYGSYCLVDTEGVVKATIGDVIVFTADERNNTTGSISYETIQNNQEYNITIHIDAGYLANENTLYPIRIDPTIEINYDNDGAGAIEDVTINEQATFGGTSGSLYIGRHPAGSLSRVLMRFPNLSLSGISADKINSATVEIRDLMCQGDEDIVVDCHIYNKSSPTWSEDATTIWSSVGTSYLGELLDSHVISYGQGNVSGESHRYSFDILDAAKEWANGSQSPSKGLVFKASSTFENQTGTEIKTWYKTFAAFNRTSNRPSFSLTYSNGDGGGDTMVSAPMLTLNSFYDVEIAYSYEKRYFKYKPTYSGYYYFESSFSSDSDPISSLFDSNQVLICSDDDGSGGYNFRLIYHLVAGHTYYFSVGCYAAEYGSYKVRLLPGERCSAVSITTDGYCIKNIATNKFIDIDGPGAQEWVHQWDFHQGTQMRWIIQRNSDNYYTIRSEYGAKKYIGVSNASSEVDNIKLYSSVSDNTRWKIYKNDSGNLLFEPKLAPGKVLCAPGDDTGAKLRLRWANATNNYSRWQSHLYGGTITAWNSDSALVGYWDRLDENDSIRVFCKKVTNDASFVFLPALTSAKTQWSESLDVSFTSTTVASQADIKIYGGTVEDLIEEGCIKGSDTRWAGITYYDQMSVNPASIFNIGNTPYYISEINKVTVLIQPGRDLLDTYIKYSESETYNIVTHEFGHALGYNGHSQNSNDVMYREVHFRDALSDNEKRHLRQIYDMYR